MAKISLDPISSGYQSTSQVNNNNTDIARNFNDLVLYRDNESGEDNRMINLLDMNTNRIINLPQPIDPTDPVRLKDVGNAIIVGDTTVIIPQSETRTLTSGQVDVTFLILETDLASFSISSNKADTGRLLSNTDFFVIDSTTIKLTSSYPAGTKITLSRNAVEGGPVIVDAQDVSYDNTVSGLTALNVQDAIDEIDSAVDTLGTRTDDLEVIINTVFTKITTNTLAVNGSTFAVDTSSSIITVTLPASPVAGDIVKILDYSGTFATNNCIVSRNGSNIMGLAENMNLDTNFLSVTLNYIDSIRGWVLA